MGKKAFMSKMKDGKQKEITVAGQEFLIKAPQLKKYGDIVKLSNQFESGENIDFAEMAKIVIDNTFDKDTGDFFFNKGDFEALKNDRHGAVRELSEEIMGLMAPTDEEQKETKKK